MKRLCLTLCLLFCTLTASGQSLEFTLGSTHYGNVRGDANETNPGVVLSMPANKLRQFEVGAVGGIYWNSYGKVSVFVGTRTRYDVADWLAFSVSVGGISGYGSLKRKWIPSGPFGTVPMFTQSVHFGNKYTKLTVTNLFGGIGFGLTFDLPV